MKTQDFYYDLPEELIAQDPLADRASSRLLRLDRKTGLITHTQFQELPGFLHPKDCLVLNDTRVLPARLHGFKSGTGAGIEVLLLKRLSDTDWECLVRPGKKCRVGTEILFFPGTQKQNAPAAPVAERAAEPPLLQGTITDILEDGNRRIAFKYTGIFEEILDRLGEMPLPPYITHPLKEKERYQTVYAEVNGSAAAPTAGLHFTKDVLQKIEARGVSIVRVTLHVGLGTFRPVKCEEITDHHMHAEYYAITEEAAERINRTKAEGGRVICVGTTSCRTLESAADENGVVRAGAGWTDIFIYPGYSFRIMDALLTNFHLPESTLLMLVSAFAGREQVLAAYAEAVRERYRFFSFGDAMFLE